MTGARAPILAAAIVFLVAPPGAAVAIDAHHASPLHRPPMIVTDAHHAALVVHAGRRPLVVSQTFTGPAPAAPSSHSTRFRAWLDPAVVWIALLGLIVGALLICRTRILQTRSVNALWDETVMADEREPGDVIESDPASPLGLPSDTDWGSLQVAPRLAGTARDLPIKQLALRPDIAIYRDRTNRAGGLTAALDLAQSVLDPSAERRAAADVGRLSRDAEAP